MRQEQIENGEASHPTIFANAGHEVIFEKLLHNGTRKKGLIHKSRMQMLNANSRYANPLAYIYGCIPAYIKTWETVSLSKQTRPDSKEDVRIRSPSSLEVYSYPQKFSGLFQVADLSHRAGEWSIPGLTREPWGA